MRQRTFQSTKYACYTGYIVQAVINNLAPLLFVIFSEKFGITLEKLTVLITVNFITQMLVDIISVKFVDQIGYRVVASVSQAVTFVGLISMALLPVVLPEPYIGIVISIMLNAVGSGLTEVIISPIVESIPGEKKTSEMSLLHSFYCWGQVLVVVVTTILIKIIGDNYWYIVPALWAIIPLVNTFNFLTVPLTKTLTEEEKTPLGKILLSKQFILSLIIMTCAGASELAMSQWSSYFAETGLKISKVTGDLLGPCLFAVFMGIGRTVFGFNGEKINMKSVLAACATLCAVCYLGTSLINQPIISLILCALTGLGVSVMWPGTLSLTSKMFPKGGSSMFGILALAGDTGCTLGPWFVSFMSLSISKNASDGDALKKGLFFGAVFPIIMIVSILILKFSEKNVDKNSNDDIIST
ncbi:MAG: MFS transporter [Oscillospiraceae bacterium]|nr:MFS transporter [Oscillospiraceae bacterium]